MSRPHRQPPLPPVVASWPFMAGSLVALAAVLWRSAPGRRLLGAIPAGDVIVPAMGSFSRWRLALHDFAHRGLVPLSHSLAVSLQRPASQRRPGRLHPEQAMNAWPVAGAVALGISGTLLLLLWTLA